MNSTGPFSRRSLLTTAGAIGGGAVLAVMLGPEPTRVLDAVLARADVEGSGAPTAPGSLPARRIEGSDAQVVLAGSAAEILLHVARRYHYEVEAIGPGDVIGYLRAPHFRGDAQATHRAGTAVYLHEGRHPNGAVQTFFPPQIEIIRDILADCEGTVYWGGDDRESPLEGHFRIARRAATTDVTRVSAKIARWGDKPGLGAGVLVDPSIPERRSRAQRLAQQMGGGPSR